MAYECKGSREQEVINFRGQDRMREGMGGADEALKVVAPPQLSICNVRGK